MVCSQVCASSVTNGIWQRNAAPRVGRRWPAVGGRRRRRWATGGCSTSGSAAGPGRACSIPPSPSERSTPHTPGSPSRLASRLDTASMAFTLRGLGTPCPPPAAGLLTTPQASLHASDRSVRHHSLRLPVAFHTGFDAGRSPDAGSLLRLLPGLLAATRTGLAPVGDDELLTVRSAKHHLQWCWAREETGLAVRKRGSHDASASSSEQRPATRHRKAPVRAASTARERRSALCAVLTMEESSSVSRSTSAATASESVVPCSASAAARRTSPLSSVSRSTSAATASGSERAKSPG